MIESLFESDLQKPAGVSLDIVIGVLAIVSAIVLARKLGYLLAGAKTTLGPEGAKRLSDASSLMIFGLALLVFLYLITDSLVFLVMLIGFIGVLALSLTTVLSNVIAYYAIASQGVLTKGAQIFLPDGAHGEVVDITPTHILIRTSGGVYIVPNSKLLNSPALISGESTAVRLNIKLWNLDPKMSAQRVLESLTESLGAIVKDLSMDALAKPRTIVYEVGTDSLGVAVDIPLASGAGLERLGRLVERLRSSLKELSPSYSIVVEPLEGYELRWKSVA
ncbi:MAG: mechanosensitive ion channel family protein [Acidilobaceae archaeon]